MDTRDQTKWVRNRSFFSARLLKCKVDVELTKKRFIISGWSINSAQKSSFIKWISLIHVSGYSARRRANVLSYGDSKHSEPEFITVLLPVAASRDWQVLMCIFNIKGEPERTRHAYNELGVEWTVIRLVLMSAIIGQTYISEAAEPDPQHSARGGLHAWWFESQWLFWSPCGSRPRFCFFFSPPSDPTLRC